MTRPPTQRVETCYFSVRNMPRRLVDRIRLLAIREGSRTGRRVTIEAMHTRVVAAGLKAIEVAVATAPENGK